LVSEDISNHPRLKASFSGCYTSSEDVESEELRVDYIDTAAIFLFPNCPF